MKKYILIILCVCVTTTNVYCVSTEEIKKSILNFLIEYECSTFSSIDDITDSSIMEIKKQEDISNCSTGVFLFNAINFHGGYAHFIIIDDDYFEIINMRDVLDSNIEKFLTFFERNEKYSKDEILYYISSLIRTYKSNTNPTGVITRKRVAN